MKAPSDYSIGEILEALEGPMSPVACLYSGAQPCDRADSCQTLPLWAEYDRLTHDFFFGKRRHPWVIPSTMRNPLPNPRGFVA